MCSGQGSPSYNSSWTEGGLDPLFSCGNWLLCTTWVRGGAGLGTGHPEGTFFALGQLHAQPLRKERWLCPQLPPGGGVDLESGDGVPNPSCGALHWQLEEGGNGVLGLLPAAVTPTSFSMAAMQPQAAGAQPAITSLPNAHGNGRWDLAYQTS